MDQLLPTVGQIERIARSDDQHQHQHSDRVDLADLVDERDEGEGEARGDDEDDAAALAQVINGTGGDGSSTAAAATAGGSDWDRALELAGLEPREELRSERRQSPAQPVGMPIPEAIHHFVQSNRIWPTHRELVEFARLAHFALASRSGHRRWAEEIEVARAHRAKLGLESPRVMPRNRTRADRLERIKAPPEGIPGVPPPSRGRRKYSRQDLIAALRVFDQELGPSERRTQKRYLAFRRGRELPSPSHFQEHGGFRVLMAEGAKCFALRRLE